MNREGNRRTIYSLRHTCILPAPDGRCGYQIAKNCRISVEMIEKYYAGHQKTTITVAAINVPKARREKKPDAEMEPAE